jgi:hypothetical protein
MPQVGKMKFPYTAKGKAAAKKAAESTDEFGNKVSMPRKATGGQSIRATGKDKTSGSRSGSSLRARGVEKGSPRRVTATGAQSARAAGAESKRGRGTQPSSARAAGAKRKANATAPRSARAAGAESRTRTRSAMTGGTARSTGAERMGVTGKRGGSSLRARGVETGGIKKAASKASSYPQSVRAAGAKAKTNDTQPSSFRAQRFGKGAKGGSAQVKPRVNQSMRAAEYRKKKPGKY